METYAGKLRIRWDDSAAVTALGQMPVFIDFLKTSGLWDGFVADCPLRYRSPNAPGQVDVLGTLLMSVLAGQWRSAHISGLRGDGANPELLGMRKVMSEDSARRAFKQATPEETGQWLRQHLRLHPEIRVVSVDAAGDRATYASGGMSLDLRPHRNRLLP